MPIYPYECDCGHEFETWLKISELETVEVTCEKCHTVLTGNHRKIGLGQTFLGEKVEDSVYDSALGCVVKGNKHRQAIAKSRGLVEIGNEKPETVHKHFESVRKEREAKQASEMEHTIMSALQ